MAERQFERKELTLAQRIRPVAALTSAAFRADPWRAGLSVGLRFVAAGSGPLFALLVARLAGHAADVGSEGGTVLIAVLLAGTVASSVVLDEIGWKVVQILQERASHQIDRQVIGLVGGLPGVEHVERPELLDKVDRLRDDQWMLAQAIEALVNWAVMLFSIVSTLLVLATVDPRLLVLPVFWIPGVWAGAKAERIRYDYLDRNSADFRLWVDYLRLANDQAKGKELRVFGLRSELVRRHNEVIAKISAWEQEHRLIGAWYQAAGRAVFAVAYVGGILWVAARVGRGELVVGDLVLTVVLGGQMLGYVRWLNGSTNWLAWLLTAVRRWIWLLDYAEEHPARVPAEAAEPVPAAIEHGIELRDVTFRYPGTEVDVLSGVDLVLPAGSTVAVVGDNGAGKTTLVKLLCRFYEPTSGQVLVDGTPLSSFDVDAWRARTSAAFQDHAPFELRAGQVVTIADLGRYGDEEAARTGLDRAGALDVLMALPRGLDTQLGPRWPTGVDLSGGQWQKLALARGMLRDDPLLLVMDEPTAALDAETEHRLFDRYAERSREVANRAGTVTVLVSHRFSTVRMADLIVVVSGGRIAEMGDHHALMASPGIYAELYTMQARAYR